MKVVARFPMQRIILTLICFVIPTTIVNAQLPSTRLSALFPPGGQAGAVTDVTLTSGVDLEEITTLVFNHPGITVAPKTHDVGGKQVPIPNLFQVSVAADVPPGKYEVRTVGFFGISNPRTFVVGALKELIETEPNNAREQAVAIEVNQTVNARITAATDIDWYKFPAKAGQRLLMDCVSRRLDSRLDAALEIYSASGKRLGFARKNLVSQDALIDLTVPVDGEYFLKVYDFTYAGGEDFPYRLTISTGPYIDFVIPAAGVPGTTSPFTLYGRNLPGGQPAGLDPQGRALEKVIVNIAVPSTLDVLDPKTILEPFSAGIDAFPYSISSATGPSNVVMIQFSNTVPTIEVEPNDNGSIAQKIVVPGEISGQYQKRGDVDCYQFDAKAKDAFWIEVIAHRAGAAVDPVLVIDQVKVNEKGEESLTRISALDDDPNNPLANLFDTLNDDNVVKFLAPADGQYRITLRERYGNSKQDMGVYRLIVRKDAPDFRVAAVATTLIPPGPRQAAPSGINLRRGDNFPIHVIALRRDGFAGPITVSAEGLPPGVTCPDISIGVAPASGILVFKSAEDTPAWAGTIRLVAKATLEDSAAVEAFTVAQNAAKLAVDELGAAGKALAKPAEDLAKANQALTAAKAELAQQPDDEGLKKKVADAEGVVATASAAVKPLADAQAAAEAKVALTNAALAKAEAAKVAAAREISHPVRYGTVVWGAPQPNIPGDARLAQSIELSVMEELAPFQLTTNVHRIDANHSRQILLPVVVTRRNGFDQPVNVTVQGQPPNVQIENKPIPKEKSEEVFRLFVPPNTPVGTYVTHLTGQAAVSYRRNPQKADRAKEELTALEQAANEVAEAIKAATAARDTAVQKATDDAANLKKLTDARDQSLKAVQDAEANEKAAAETLKNAGDDASVKAEAEKKLAEVRLLTKAALEAKTAAEKQRIEAEAAAKSAEEARAKAEAELKALDEKSKSITAAKAAADQKFKAADAYAKAANLNFHPTTTPIVITVKPAPYTLSAAPADGGNVKVGARNEVKCEIKRQNGFAGPVTLTLPLPPNVGGVKAEPVTIPADQSAGTLVIEAAADAAEAALANMVVRATSQFDGEAAVDQPITLKIVK